MPPRVRARARDNVRPMTRPVASVERALALLDALAAHPEGLGVNELARRIGVNASTASRLLATLEGARMVETATLSVPGGAEGVTVDFVPAESSVVSVARLGRPSVGHSTAVGKVMLAFGGDDGRTADLPRYTERTIVEPAALAAEVAAVRARGWGEAAGEREPHLNGLAAPVFGRGGALAALVGLQGPAARLTPERRREVLPALLGVSAQLSGALGGTAPDG